MINFIAIEVKVDYLPEGVRTWCEDERNICKKKKTE